MKVEAKRKGETVNQETIEASELPETLEEKSVFGINELIPLKGFWFRVIETDTHTVKLEVCGLSKAGERRGFKVTKRRKDEATND